MISSLNARDQMFLNSVARITGRLEEAQRLITTGVRVSQVSDDPDQISSLLLARAELASTTQMQTNLGRIKAEVDAAEESMRSAVELWDRAHTLAAQGATSTQTASGRSLLAEGVGTILQQFAALAATKVEGRYLFSGDADQIRPYSVDLSSSNPASAYAGSPATRVAQGPNGATFLVGHTAQTIFDSADADHNVLAALTSLRQALSDNDDAAIQASLDSFSRISSHLNGELAFYGATQNKVEDAIKFTAAQFLQLQSKISNVADADPTAAILELNQAQIQHQAALSARAKVPQTSLFDYLG